MTGDGDRALLPAGLQDVLPPEAAHEAAVVERLIACLSACGYDRVKPPLLEFEEGLLSGTGAKLTQQTFRLMDPVSQRMMALRADMTPQVARIATSRLGAAPRPLRLCYGGQVLRVRGTQLRPERQFGQVGAELIGAPQAEADAEVVLLAVEALEALGVSGLSVDLTQPTLLEAVAEALKLDITAQESLLAALDHKDTAAVSALAGENAALFGALLGAAGPADKALEALASIAVPAPAAGELARLARVAGLLREAAPELIVTLDPLERRGFEYQTGVSFTLFARGVRGELGRGGRYASALPSGGSESSTGFSLYMDTVLRALPLARMPARVYLAHGWARAQAKSLHAEGWVTVAGLEAVADPAAEARRLGCSHVLSQGRIEPLEG